jgi:hypothetical protein
LLFVLARSAPASGTLGSTREQQLRIQQQLK